MASICFLGVAKVFPDGTRAVDDLDLEVADGGFTVLVGPSGSGKSTALRMVAGLEEATSGTIRIADRVVNDIAPKDRDIAMVFQSYALYPHMSVEDNLGFALKMQGVPRKSRVASVARRLGIGELLARRPRQLSGGQRQRVALGRAIVREPQAFLMDEPLSNLDAKLRVEMRAEITRIQRDLRVTTMYVTHDQTEAMTLGDRVAVMRAGLIQQVDTPANLYDNPQNLFVAGFIGSPSMNFLPGRLEGDVVKTPIGDLTLPDQLRQAMQRREAGARDVIVGVRPEQFEDAAVEQDDHADRHKFRAHVDVVESMGSELYVYFDVESQGMDSDELSELAADSGMEDLPSHGDGQQIVARLSSESKASPGAEVELTVDLTTLKLFAADDGRSLTSAAS
jgi:multiple sugar transport system ATP-binding protein